MTVTHVFRTFCAVILLGCGLMGQPAFAAQTTAPENPPATHGGKLVLSIVYSADTWGSYDPCPVCGEKMLGGLARRSTFFALFGLKVPKDRRLLLAGPNEFLNPFKPDENPDGKHAPAFAQSYQRLGYDKVFITPEEALWLKDNGAAPSPSFTTVGAEPVVETVTKSGVTIGLLVFPLPKQGELEMPMDLMKQMTAEAQKLRPGVQLIIGLSAWGKKADQIFLNTQEPAFDVLLGSGPGPGLTGDLLPNAGSLWARTYTKGKYLNVIDIFALPDPKAEKKWGDASTFSFSYATLNIDIPEDPAIKSLFHGDK